MKMVAIVLLLWFAILIQNIVEVTSECNIYLSNNSFSVVVYGDGIHYDDLALQTALNICNNGGRIVFPVGRYLLSPFNLTSNIELYLEENAILLATTDHTKWPIVQNLPGYPAEPSGRVGAFISGTNITNVKIIGPGTIDGQGSAWWNKDGLIYGRPRLIEPMFCKSFTMVNTTILNPPFWAIHYSKISFILHRLPLLIVSEFI